MTAFTPSGRNNPCPMCDRTKDGDCRVTDNGLVLCHTELNGVKKGERHPERPFVYCGHSDDAQGFGTWKPEHLCEEKPEKPKREPKTQYFDYCFWDGTPTPAQRYRTDFADGRDKEVKWCRGGLQGRPQTDVAPYFWHEMAPRVADGELLFVTKGELKVRQLQAHGYPAVSILGTSETLTAKLRAFGASVVLTPDCDLKDLDGWYHELSNQLPEARTLMPPLKGMNWRNPPQNGGLGVEDWLQRSKPSSAVIQAAISLKPWEVAGVYLSEWEQVVLNVKNIDDPVERTKSAWSLIRERSQAVILDGAKVIEQQAILKALGKEFGLNLDKRDIDHVLSDVVREATTKVEPVMGGGRLTVNPKRWVLQDLILHGFNLLNGMPGAGKSRILMALVLAWVNGHDSFLGHKLYAPPNARVLILGLDQDLQEWSDVMAPLGLMTEVGFSTEKKNYDLHPSIDLYPLGSGVSLDRDGRQLISRWSAENLDGLIIGDSVSALLPAGVSESDDSLGRWARDVDEARRGAPLVLTHHITKEAAFSGNTGVYAGRGSGSLDAAASRVLGLSYQFHKQDGKDVLHTDSPRRQLVSQKRGATNQSLIVEMGPSGCWDYIGTAADERELERERIEGPADERLIGWKKDVYAATTNDWLTTSQIRDRLDPVRQKKGNSQKQTLGTLRDLELDNRLIERKEADTFQGQVMWRRKQEAPT